MDYSYLTTCEAMTDDDFRSAVSSPENTRAFLKRIAQIARPNSGVGRILHFFVRLAQSEQMRAIQRDEFEDFTIQVSRSRDATERFVVRLAAVAGLEGRPLYKTSVLCDFQDFLEPARDKENMHPFVCTNSHEDFMFFEATYEEVKNSVPPPAYLEAEERIKELEAAGMLNPSRWIPTIVPPDEGEDPNDNPELEQALVKADIPEIPPLPVIRTTPPELSNATVFAGQKDGNKTGKVIGRISLAKMRADEADKPKPKNKPRDRRSTKSLPAIDKDDDPGLPLVTAKKDEEVDDGWADIPLPIVNPKKEKQ